MLFNSASFLLFLVLVFTLYWGLNGQRKAQNWLILIASYFFYGAWDWGFLVLIAISSMVDFIVGRSMTEAKGFNRKVLLGISLGVNLGLLGFFKYFNFFIESASAGLSAVGFETSMSSLNIILPVGISFYTFQTLSYTIDIYRRQVSPTKNWLEFFAFVSFFPQLVAGPIERARNLLPQFENNRVFSRSLAVSGLRLILWGLFKKMVIADRLAVLVDGLYADPGSNNTLTATLAGVFFAYQIYCDFSGYSDIAIGSGRLLGFKLMRNFITPFQSRSSTELWKRWHVSLSSWFKDYLYIPLGGGHVSTSRWAINIIVTFTVSGLWHGADINFILWGFMCALPIVAERLMKGLKPGVVITFLLFSLTLILFRSESLDGAWVMYCKLFSLNGFHLNALLSIVEDPFDLWYTFGLLGLFVFSEWKMGKPDFDEAMISVRSFFRWSVYYGLLLLIFLFGITDNAPQFIYFQF